MGSHVFLQILHNHVHRYGKKEECVDFFEIAAWEFYANFGAEQCACYHACGYECGIRKIEMSVLRINNYAGQAHWEL